MCGQRSTEALETPLRCGRLNRLWVNRIEEAVSSHTRRKRPAEKTWSSSKNTVLLLNSFLMGKRNVHRRQRRVPRTRAITTKLEIDFLAGGGNLGTSPNSGSNALIAGLTAHPLYTDAVTVFHEIKPVSAYFYVIPVVGELQGTPSPGAYQFTITFGYEPRNASFTISSIEDVMQRKCAVHRNLGATVAKLQTPRFKVAPSWGPDFIDNVTAASAGIGNVIYYYAAVPVAADECNVSIRCKMLVLFRYQA